jgi:hypothetical protein
MRARFLLLLFVAVAGAAQADRGELSLELGLGAAAVNVRSPYADGNPSAIGTMFATSLGATYAQSNHLELDARAFWEPPATFVHPNATVQGLPGSLSESTQRFGALAGARVVTGYAWRFFAGLDLGASIRAFSQADHFDVKGSTPRSYGLQLADTTQMAIDVAPNAGVAFVGDHYSIGVSPRFELLLGSPTTWSFVLPLTLTYGWFL